MLVQSAFLSLSALAGLVAGSPACTADKRIAAAQQIPDAYNNKALGGSAAGFAAVPFASDCTVQIYANGLPGVLVAVDDTTTRAVALSTRQAFSEVTGEYIDFPNNGTTDIMTNVVRPQLRQSGPWIKTLILFVDAGTSSHGACTFDVLCQRLSRLRSGKLRDRGCTGICNDSVGSRWDSSERSQYPRHFYHQLEPR